MSKIEKILYTFITWVYLGVLLGVFSGALFGGRGGMLFFTLGFYTGLLIGVLRSVYVGYNFDNNSIAEADSRKRVIGRRVFLSFLYLFAIYTTIANILDPVQW